MLTYYAWAASEKALSYVPGGKLIYRGVSNVVNSGTRSRRRLAGTPTSYRLVRRARELTPLGGSVLDLGTGWHHHDAFLLYLCGDYNFFLFDIEDKATIEYIQVYLKYLLEVSQEVSRELSIPVAQIEHRLTPLLTCKTRDEVYRACNFKLCITDQTNQPFLPTRSLDFVTSNCVLTHIPPHIVEPELKALGKMLKPEGHMYMMVGHDDHWSFHDNSMNQFNYYRYSDRLYRSLFDTKFEYQNRMVKSEWLPIFARAGLEVIHYYGHITDESRADIARLPRIADRFARYPIEELATIHSYFLLRLAR